MILTACSKNGDWGMVDGVVIPQCFWIDKGSNVKNTLVQQKDINVNHSLCWILKISSTLGMASVPCKWEMRINFNAHFPADFQISKHGSSQDSGIKTIHRSSCFIRHPAPSPNGAVRTRYTSAAPTSSRPDLHVAPRSEPLKVAKLRWEKMSDSNRNLDLES